MIVSGSLLNDRERLLAEARAATDRAPFWQLLATHVSAEPARYLLSTLALLVRGLGVTGGLLVLLALFALPALARRLAALAAGSLLCLTAVQALLTPNR